MHTYAHTYIYIYICIYIHIYTYIFLAKQLQIPAEVRLEQVVAMEPDFSLLTRIWCIAELVEAKKLHLPQVGHGHGYHGSFWGNATKRKNMEKYENIHVCLAIGKVGEMDEFLSFLIWENMRHDRDFSQRHEAIMIHSAASRTDCLKRHMASVARIKYDQVMGYPLEFLKKWSSTTSG